MFKWGTLVPARRDFIRISRGLLDIEQPFLFKNQPVKFKLWIDARCSKHTLFIGYTLFEHLPYDCVLLVQWINHT